MFIFVVESIWYLILWVNTDLLFIIFSHKQAQIHDFLSFQKML